MLFNRKKLRECKRLYEEAVRDIDAIQVVDLPPGSPALSGYPQKHVIYMQMREEDEDE